MGTCLIAFAARSGREPTVYHETPVSAFEDPSRPPAWLPRPYGHQEWPNDPQPPAPSRAQAPDPGLIDPRCVMSAPSGPRFGLQRGQRLRAGRDFVRLKESGQRWIQGCLILNWQPALEGHSGSRLGVVTSKSIGNAVCRNRARRLLKEVFRRHQHELGRPVDMILVARKSIVGKGLDAVEADYIRSLKGARLRSDRSPTLPPAPR